MPEPIVPGVVPTEAQKQGTEEVVLSRACDYCRGLKVRCLPDPESSSGICQRCSRSKRTCTFTPRSRKQRKRTDTRVAELEREMKAMRSLLRLGSDGGSRAIEDIHIHSTEQSDVNMRYAQDAYPNHTISSREYNNDGVNLTQSPPVSMDMQPRQISNRTDSDVVDKGLLSMTSATELFNIYVNELTPHYPVVTFPENYTADKLRYQRPTLFLAVIAAASGKTDPNLYSLLNTELLEIYASQTVISGEKNLEFVQSMLVTTMWYYLNDTYDELKFYQYVHMAATIALDIGLGSKPSPGSISCRLPRSSTNVYLTSEMQNSQDVSPQSTGDEPEIATVDARRTILVCYILCSGVAIGMRRPNMLRFNSWMKRCINFFENYPMATIFDKRLIARVRLQNIAEEFASSLGLEDPDDTSIVLDSRTLLTLKAFERRLKLWRESQDPEIMNAGMLMIYHQTNILLHEVALRGDHPTADFKPPYFVNRSHPELRVKEKLTGPVIDAVMQCVISSHDLLDTFLRLEVNTLRALPVHKFVMVLYATVILIKLSQSVNDPTSEIGKILDHSSLALASYSDAVADQLMKAAGPEEFRVPSKFHFVILRMQAFSRRQESFPGMDNGDKAIYPLLQLSSQESSSLGTNSHGVRALEEIGRAEHASKSNGPIPSNKKLSSNSKTTTIYSHASSFTQDIDSTRDSSAYPDQSSAEPVYAYNSSASIQESGINYGLDMDPSILSETGLFTEDLDNWMSSTSVTNQHIDQQMIDFSHWPKGNNSQG